MIFGTPPIITNGLVLYLDAGSRMSYPGSGTTWNDLSGNRNSGSLVNGPTYSSADQGSIVFDGVNDYVESLNNTGISSTAPRSLCVWFNLAESLTNRFYSVAKIGVGTTGQLFEMLLYNNSIVSHFWGAVSPINAASGKILLNNYTYVVMTYSSTALSIYVDGAIKRDSQPVNLDTSNSKLVLGFPQYNTAVGGDHFYFKGQISMAQLYNRALSASEVLQILYATRTRFGI